MVAPAGGPVGHTGGAGLGPAATRRRVRRPGPVVGQVVGRGAEADQVDEAQVAERLGVPRVAAGLTAPAGVLAAGRSQGATRRLASHPVDGRHAGRPVGSGLAVRDGPGRLGRLGRLGRDARAVRARHWAVVRRQTVVHCRAVARRGASGDGRRPAAGQPRPTSTSRRQR